MRRPAASGVSFPFHFEGKTVLLEDGPLALARVQDSHPEAIAAPLRTALELARAKTDGALNLPELSFAIVVLTGAGERRMSAADRDLIWKAFHVPVFEQFRDRDGAIVARECELHNGLHLAPNAKAGVHDHELWINGRSTGLSARLDREHCECGQETPRLRDAA